MMTNENEWPECLGEYCVKCGVTVEYDDEADELSVLSWYEHRLTGDVLEESSGGRQ